MSHNVAWPAQHCVTRAEGQTVILCSLSRTWCLRGVLFCALGGTLRGGLRLVTHVPFRFLRALDMHSPWSGMQARRCARVLDVIVATRVALRALLMVFSSTDARAAGVVLGFALYLVRWCVSAGQVLRVMGVQAHVS